MSARLCMAAVLAVLCAGVGRAFPQSLSLVNPGTTVQECNECSSTQTTALVISAGIFFPASARVRDRFGNSWFGFGLSIGNGENCPSRPMVTSDIGFTSRASGSNYVYLLPVGLSYLAPLSSGTQGSVAPFAGVGADLVFSDIRSIPDQVSSNIRVGGELSLIAGIALFRNWQLEARYNFVSPIAGFDFSGLSVSLSTNVCYF